MTKMKVGAKIYISRMIVCERGQDRKRIVDRQGVPVGAILAPFWHIEAVL